MPLDGETESAVKSQLCWVLPHPAETKNPVMTSASPTVLSIAASVRASIRPGRNTAGDSRHRRSIELNRPSRSLRGFECNRDFSPAVPGDNLEPCSSVLLTMRTKRWTGLLFFFVGVEFSSRWWAVRLVVNMGSDDRRRIWTSL